MLEKIKNLILKLNEKGIPVPLLMDKGAGSISGTLLLVSFANAIYAIDTQKNTDSLMYAMALFTVCGSMYFGKKWQVRKMGSLSVDSATDDSKEDAQK